MVDVIGQRLIDIADYFTGFRTNQFPVAIIISIYFPFFVNIFSTTFPLIGSVEEFSPDLFLAATSNVFNFTLHPIAKLQSGLLEEVQRNVLFRRATDRTGVSNKFRREHLRREMATAIATFDGHRFRHVLSQPPNEFTAYSRFPETATTSPSSISTSKVSKNRQTIM